MFKIFLKESEDKMTAVKASPQIKIEKPTAQQLEALKIKSWPIWTKEPSQFDWCYDEPETCYFLEGDVTIETKEGRVTFGKGDLVTFPQGLSCVWHVKKAVRKHYRFGPL